MPKREIIVVGASAGGFEAMGEFLAGLPANFPGAIFMVLHTSPQGPGTLPKVLRRGVELPVLAATDGQAIRPGHVYVAPPDHHLVLERGRMCLSRGATENRNRPAIDPLFRSAAQAYGRSVVGILLSGYLDDGVAGLVAIKRHGGIALVQSPDDALVPDMPLAALENDHVDFSVPVKEMPALLMQLISGGPLAKVTTMARKKTRREEKGGPGNGRVSVFTCPDCHGTLWEVDDHGMVQFRCRVGHSYMPESMAEAQSQSVERALWAALRSLEERVDLSRRLAERAKKSQHPIAARRFSERAEASAANAKVLRDILTGQERPARQKEPDELEELPGAKSRAS